MADRDENGRFVKGHGGAPNAGRPKKPREERYREILKEAITYEDFRAIIKRMGEKAKRGDVQAAKLLLEYLVGKPEQILNLGNKDGSPLTFEVVYVNPPPQLDENES